MEFEDLKRGALIVRPDYRMIVLGIPTPEFTSDLKVKVGAGNLCYKVNRIINTLIHDDDGDHRVTIDTTSGFHEEGIFGTLNPILWRDCAKEGYCSSDGAVKKYIEHRKLKLELLRAALKDLRRGGDYVVAEGDLKEKMNFKSVRKTIEKLLD